MTRIELPASPQRILIIKPSALGDVVHTLPVLNLLRTRWPQAHISWLIGSAFAGLIERHPHDFSARSSFKGQEIEGVVPRQFDVKRIAPKLCLFHIIFPLGDLFPLAVRAPQVEQGGATTLCDGSEEITAMTLE